MNDFIIQPTEPAEGPGLGESMTLMKVLGGEGIVPMPADKFKPLQINTMPMMPSGGPTLPQLHIGEPKPVPSQFEGHTALQGETQSGKEIIYHYKEGKPVEASYGKDTYFPDEIAFPELESAVKTDLPSLHTGPTEIFYLEGKPAGISASTPDGGTVIYSYEKGVPVYASVYDANGNASGFYLPFENKIAFPPLPYKTLPTLHSPSSVPKVFTGTEGNLVNMYETPNGETVSYIYDPKTLKPIEALTQKTFTEGAPGILPGDINFPRAVPFMSPASGPAEPSSKPPVSTPAGEITYGDFNYPKLPKNFLPQDERILIGEHRFTSDIMKGQPPPEVHKLNDIIAKYPIPEDTPTWRGVSKGVFDKFDATPIGGTFMHSSLYQTSANPEFGKGWRAGHYLELVIPKGTPAFPASNYTGIKEWEYVLQTGQRFKVLDKGTDDFGRQFIKVELVPRFRPIPQEAAASLPHPLLGIPLYHSSPFEFQRFSTSQVGTGESTVTKAPLLQGYGHYLAEEPLVAKKYFDVAKKKNITDAIRKDLQQGFDLSGPEIDRTIQETLAIPADELYQQSFGVGPEEPLARAINARVRMEHYGRPAFTYRTLAHIDPNYLLDSDKPLSDQTPQVKAALARAGIDLSRVNNVKSILPQTHEEMINYLRAGIQGVRYFDAKSRARGAGTRNYVVYDDDALDIAKKGYFNEQGEWYSYGH